MTHVKRLEADLVTFRCQLDVGRPTSEHLVNRFRIIIALVIK